MTKNKTSKLNDFNAKLHRFTNLLKKKWWILLITITISIFIQSYKFKTQPTNYISEAQLYYSGQLNINLGISYRESRIQDFFKTQIELIKNPSIQRRARESVQLLFPEIEPCSVKIGAKHGIGSAMINLKAIGQNADYVQHFLSAVISSYSNYRKDEKTKITQSTETSLTQELIIQKKQALEEKKILEDFEKKNDFILDKDHSNKDAQYLMKLETRRLNLKTKLDLMTLHQTEETIPEDSDENMSEIRTSEGSNRHNYNRWEGRYFQAKRNLTFIKKDLEEKKKVFRPKHPKIIALKRAIERQMTDLDVFKQQKLENLEQRKKTVELTIKNLDEEIDIYKKKAINTSKLLGQHARLKENYMRAKENEERMNNKILDIYQGQILNTEPFSIINPPNTPLKEDPSKLKPITSGFSFGLIIGLIILFIIDRFDDRINSVSEFNLYFSEEVLGQIADEGSARKKKKNEHIKIIHPNDTRHHFIESFRNLRSSLLFKEWEDKPPRNFVITSAVPSEGKSTIASNFAATLALGGAEVLLVG